ncbi:hypothetical protein HHI36_005485 [Cryptolaemus montrouzieri]|uniref:Uncharacterized protein n=1 Tax=Cryptolaemus montrouzieri TaxID=559131 RepID=A0ABD2NVB0_9CUCU
MITLSYKQWNHLFKKVSQDPFSICNRKVTEKSNQLRFSGWFVSIGTRCPVKLIFQGTSTSSVSKLPPVLEYFLQRIQSANSNFVHEDLSRPQTWEKPIYTLSPEEEAYFYGTPQTPLPHEAVVAVTETITTSKYDNFEYEELENTTEILFEKITDAPSNPPLINNNQYVIYKTVEISFSLQKFKQAQDYGMKIKYNKKQVIHLVIFRSVSRLQYMTSEIFNGPKYDISAPKAVIKVHGKPYVQNHFCSE